MVYKRAFFGILILTLLVAGLVVPLHTANAKAVEVTVTVQRPADLTFSPHPDLPADIIFTLLMVDHGQNVQKAPSHLVYVYLRNLQVARINSVQSAADGSQTYTITFAVEEQTARLLSWTEDSRVPIRFTQSEVF